jgi:hypothetical protein
MSDGGEEPAVAAAEEDIMGGVTISTHGYLLAVT